MKLARVGAAIAAVAHRRCGVQRVEQFRQGPSRSGSACPLSGSSLASAGPARDGALLAIKEANAAGTVKGYTLTTDILDHSVNGQYDAQQGAKDMTTLVSDSAVMAVVGPFNSAVAKVQIPISNQAGLLQCSPANTNQDLTKGDPAQAAPVCESGQDQLHPRRHDGRHPGPGGRAVRVQRPRSQGRRHRR